MKDRTAEEIETFVSDIWEDAENVATQFYDGKILITVSAMYEAPSLNFDRLMKLSEFMGTKNINDDDRFGYGGCETCDYGSDYGYTLTIREDTE